MVYLFGHKSPASLASKQKKRLSAERLGIFLLIVSLFGSLIATQPAAAASVPHILPYQGKLLDSAGLPLGGATGSNYCFRFSFYSTSTVGAGTKLWPTASTPATMTATVKSGLFTIGIGDTAAGGDLLDFNFQSTDSLFLNVEVAGTSAGSCSGVTFETLAPRQSMLSVAYALQAASVLGTEASGFGTTEVFPGANVSIQASSSRATPLIIRGAPSQVVNLLEIQNDVAAKLLTVNALGGVGVSSSLQVSGPTQLYSTLAVDNLALFSSGFIASASSTITNLFTNQLSATTIAANTASITGALNVTGATITGLSTSNLADAASLAKLNQNQTFTGINTFSNDTWLATAIIASTTVATANITNLNVLGALSLTGNSISDAMVVDSITASNYLLLTGGSLSGLTNFQTGFISNASSSVGSSLQVAGALNASSSLLVSGLSTLQGGLLVNNASSTITNLNSLTVTATNGTLQNLTVTGALNLTGATVTGLATTNLADSATLVRLANNQTFTGLNAFSATTTFSTTTITSAEITNAAINNLTVSGSLTLPANSITDAMIADSITASNYLLLSGGILTGLTNFQTGFISNASSSIGSNLQVTGALNASSSLSVSGLSTLNGGLLINNSSSTITNLFTNSLTASAIGASTVSITGALNVTGATITGLSTSNLSDAAVLARLASNQIFTGLNTFSATTTFTTTTAALANLTAATINNLTVAGSVALPANSLTDAMVVDSITASNYLLLTGDTLSGLTNFQTGFISNASSSIGAGLQVAGALNASNTLFVKNLSTLTGGFISNASSSIVGSLQVAGSLNASSSLIVSATTTVGGLRLSKFTTTGAVPFVGNVTGDIWQSPAFNFNNANSSLTLQKNGSYTGGSATLQLFNDASDNFIDVRRAGFEGFTLFQVSALGNIDAGASNFSQRLGDASVALNVGNTNSAVSGLVVTAAAGQTANLAVYRSATSLPFFTIGGSGGAYFGTSTLAAAGLSIVSTSTSATSLLVTARPGQTANLLSVKNSALSDVVTINSAGLVGLNQGFISNASSSIGSGLQVAGPLNASSTLLVRNNFLSGLNNNSNIGIFGNAFRNVVASGTLDISGGSSLGGLRIRATNSTTTLVSLVSGAGAGAFVLDTSSTLANAASSILLSVRNNSTKVMSLSAGGNLRTTGAMNANQNANTIGDFAEYIDVSPEETVEPGDIVIADPNNPEKFKKSIGAYALGVAGVISDTGQFLIGAEGPGRAALSLAGLVHVKASAENGPIVVGDYVVTASKPGVAMRYNPEDGKTASVVGLAISALASGEGEITIVLSRGLVGSTSAKVAPNVSNAPGSLVGSDGSLISFSAVDGAITAQSLKVNTLGTPGLELSVLSDTVFFGRPYLNNDSGGFALIKEGSKSVTVTFDREYLEQPVITTSISLEEATSTQVSGMFPEALENLIFDRGVQYLISRKNTKSFTIVLNRAAPADIRFSWLAVAIKNPRLSISDSDTPIVLTSPVSEPAVEPTVEPSSEPEVVVPAPLENTETPPVIPAETPVVSDSP